MQISKRLVIMVKVTKAKIGDLIIEGYEGDYVFETIRKNNDFYEKAILEKWTPHLKDSKSMLDIGANLGNHTLYWATQIPESRIYSFEPYLPTFERLMNNVRQNQLQNVKLFNKGVGKKKAFAYVAHIDEKNMGATALEYDTDGDGEIEIVDIDSLVREKVIAEAVDFVKIDTEGFEIDVLEGMEFLLKEMLPDLWIEVGKDTYCAIMDKLGQLDYVLSDIEGANLLFLSKKRHPQISSIDTRDILEKMFHYLQRTNDYYGLYSTVKEKYEIASDNYETAKKWNNNLKIKCDSIEEKNEKILQNNAELKEEINGLKEKIERANGEIVCLNNEISELQQGNNLYLGKVKEYYIHLQEEENVLNDLLLGIRQLELTNRQLEEENTRYKQKIERIKKTFIGKIAFKAYHLLKKVKIKFRSK